MQVLSPNELIVDLFAGGGGASLGIELATGRSPDIAVNHDAEAIAMHAVNHPTTRHYATDVWGVDPVEATSGKPVGLMWLSPDCKHFSKAKGAKPRDLKVRDLAWTAVDWARTVRPRCIILENVEEFKTWGPLDDRGMPLAPDAGVTFNAFVRSLQRLSYRVEWRELRACNFRAPTIRKRLYVIAMRDDQPVIWPNPTHSKDGRHGLLPWRAAAECIDWAIESPSIFERTKPLVPNTLRRIAAGLRKYVIESANPFLAPVSAYRGGRQDHSTLVTAFLAKHYSERRRGEVMGSSLEEPIGTVTTVDHHALVTATMVQVGYGERERQAPRALDIKQPLGTVVGTGKHALVVAFLVAYYGAERDGGTLNDPLRTVTTKDRFGLVTVESREYQIVDIGMRMLTPRELFRAQGFPDSYQIEAEVNGKRLSKATQIRMCGNSVCPPVAAALVRAQFSSSTAAQEAA